MSDDPKFDAWLKRAVEGSGEKIESANMFLSLVSKGYADDPLCALQLGIAVMLDKPIYLLVTARQEVGDNLRRLARAIEYYDPDNPKSLDAATKALISRWKQANP